MRVNVYAEEMTDRIEIIGKEIDCAYFVLDSDQTAHLYPSAETGAVHTRNESSGCLASFVGSGKQDRRAPMRARGREAEAMSEELWGVWAWNTGRPDWGFWRHVDGGLDLRTTEAEARRLAAHYSRPTSFNADWRYEARRLMSEESHVVIGREPPFHTSAESPAR